MLCTLHVFTICNLIYITITCNFSKYLATIAYTYHTRQTLTRRICNELHWIWETSDKQTEYTYINIDWREYLNDSCDQNKDLRHRSTCYACLMCITFLCLYS